MVASSETQRDNNHQSPAVETRRGAAMAEPAHGTEWPGCHELHPWHAQYHEGLPSRTPHSQQRLGMGGKSLSLQRPGRGRR